MSDEQFDRFQRFPTTQWTLVGQAGLEFNAARRDALNELLRRYWSALRTHLIVRKRIESNLADDLVQGFIEKKILERDLVSVAERGRGRFRNLLLTALDNYVANEMQKRNAQKRAADRASSLDVDERSQLATGGQSPDQAFDQAWARQLLNDSITRMEQECRSDDRDDVWKVFQARVLAPILEGAEPTDYATLVEQCGFKSPAQASNVLVTGKRMFARVLRGVIAEYASSEEEIEMEIQELESVLSGG